MIEKNKEELTKETPEEITDVPAKELTEKEKKVPVFAVVLCAVLFLIVAAVAGYFLMKYMGKHSLTSHDKVKEVEITAPEAENVEISDAGKIVTYKGTKYSRNENVISILCMGIDREEFSDEDSVIGTNGQADTILVVTLNTVTGETKMINISRDSMIDVDLYNVNNEFAGTEKMQLCLSYAYGDGHETSCENTMKSVSRLLYGMPIDAYAAIDISAISVLNDAIGGVEVTVMEDLSDRDPKLVQGATVLLKGNQAVKYVRSRDAFGPKAWIHSNNARMARQKQYLLAFISKTLSATKEDITIPLNLYQTATDYMVTDIGASEVTYLAEQVLKSGFDENDMITVPGEVIKGEVYAEYYVDEQALYEIILDVYYDEV